ncbi:MAG: signal peptidase I, partial [Dehalococcoidia bacterium]|nr:signal peptidase I [Dehalococcoidia bacterium]
AGSELQQTKLDLAATQAELAATNTRMSSTRAELDAANVTIASTRAQLSTTQNAREDALYNMTITRTKLDAALVRVKMLETEQAKYYVSTFACTGSMEPYITCADEAVWKRVFVPANIQVGTVIAFRNPTECSFRVGGTTAHRVIEVKPDGASYLYHTKGDNNRAADSCWVPLANVSGVLALVRKDARPENVIDTTEYKIARQELSAIADQKDAVEKQYEAALVLYQSTFDRYCGNARQLKVTCTLPPDTHKVVNPLYLSQEALSQQLNQLFEAYQRKGKALDAIQCKLFKLYC